MAIQKTLQALSDPTRREILRLLQKKSMCASDIANCFETSKPAISRHLSVLKEADLVRNRREGKFLIYELNASVLEEVIIWLHNMKGDLL